MRIIKKILICSIIYSSLLEASPVITEIFFVPETSTSAPQYIELYNNDSIAIDLERWTLATLDSTGGIIFSTRFEPNESFIQINNYVDSDLNSSYDLYEPILIPPYSYFLISSSYCGSINNCYNSSEFYNDYAGKADIIMHYLYFPHSKGSIVIANKEDKIIDVVSYDYELGWPVQREEIKGRALRLHVTPNEETNNLPNNWSLSPLTEISSWLYDFETGVVNNFGSPREENSFKLDNIIDSDIIINSGDTHKIEGDVNAVYSDNNYYDPLKFSWLGTNIEDKNYPEGQTLQKKNYSIIIEKISSETIDEDGNIIYLENSNVIETLETEDIDKDVLPSTLNIDSLGIGREIAQYTWTVELIKTYLIQEIVIYDTIYSDKYNFIIDASSYGRYGCVDNGYCTNEFALIADDNNLGICPTSESSDELFQSKHPYGCKPGVNCIQAINYYSDANINSGTCHYVYLTTPKFTLGEKLSSVKVPIYLYNDSLAHIEKISYSLNIEDNDSFSFDSLTFPSDLDNYLLSSSFYQENKKIQIEIDLDGDKLNNTYGYQGIINFIDFKLSDQNISTAFEIDNIFIESNLVYNNSITSPSEIGNIVTLDDSYEIWGNILYYDGETPYEIPGVELTLDKLFDGTNNFNTVQTTTNTFGYYNFESLTEGSYTLSFSKQFTEECNGDYISGIDISRIAKHVNNNSSFSFNQMIVADISLDGNVTSLDASLLAQYNVGLINNFNSENLHWIFRPTIDSTFGVLNADLIESSKGTYSISYSPLLFDDIDRKINGYRLGDVSGNYCKQNSSRNKIDYNNFSQKNINFQPIITIPIILSTLNPVEGVDFEIKYDKDVFEPISINFNYLNDNNYQYMSNIINSDSIISVVIWSIDKPHMIKNIIGEISFNWKDEYKSGKIWIDNFLVNENNAIGLLGLEKNDKENLFSGVHIYNNQIPEKFSIDQNYPNPFNPKTTIYWSMPEPSDISIDIYNINGQLIESIFNGYLDIGNHQEVWDASSYTSGVYFYRLKVGELILQKKMILLK